MTTEQPTNEVYAETREALISLVRGLTPEQAATIVPACPAWSVKDVVSHVCGLVAGLVAGVREGLGTDEATAEQVASRATMSGAEVCDEWAGYAPALDALLLELPPIAPVITGDLIVHVHDIHEALGLTADPDSAATIIGAHRYVPLVQERAADRIDTALSIELADGSTWPAPNPDAAAQLTLRASPFDFLRSVTGRRPRSFVEGLDWTGDAAALLDEAWTTYGDFPPR